MRELLSSNEYAGALDEATDPVRGTRGKNEQTLTAG
jgi:hypothetical protein